MNRLFSTTPLTWLGAAALGLAVLTAPLAGPAQAFAQTAAADGALTVTKQRIADRKAVFATVEPTDIQAARTRIGGTLAALSVDEGDAVEAGQQIAVVGDEKLRLQLQSFDARIKSLQAQVSQARIDLNRAERLYKSGVIPKARLDEARTNARVLARTLEAQKAERQVVAQQAAEGAVLAPETGRVLDVLVTEGAVVLPGERVAMIATAGYVLRMEVPERHARFIAAGDTVLVGPRGLSTAPDGALRDGTVTKVYPRLKNGRVIADIEVDGLGDYYVGERAIVYVVTGTRDAFVVPPHYLSTRFGVTYAQLADGTRVVVQPGNRVDGGIEVLSGLRDGDVIVPFDGAAETAASGPAGEARTQ